MGPVNVDLGLRDRVAVVTGSSRGIGQAIAYGLAKEGAQVTICARNIDKLMDACMLRKQFKLVHSPNLGASTLQPSPSRLPTRSCILVNRRPRLPLGDNQESCHARF